MGARENQSTTKDQILDAAYTVFLAKGSNAAGIQEIADRAGVNKAMLYYYFDSKDLLFREVFLKAYRESGLQAVSILEEDIPLFDKIRKYIHTVIDNLIENPELSSFVLRELNLHSHLLSEILMEEMEYSSSRLNDQINTAADNYEIARVSPKQLLVNITSLCLFPAANKRYYTMLLDLKGEEEYDEILNERKGIIYDMVISWLTT